MTRSRDEFLRDAGIEASKLERFARQLRAGKWDTFHSEETISRNGAFLPTGPAEKVTVFFRATRLQKQGTGLVAACDEEPAPLPDSTDIDAIRKWVEDERVCISHRERDIYRYLLGTIEDLRARGQP